jgi:hypothetical protein
MSKPPILQSQDRWIVQGDEVASGRLGERIKSDPEIKQLNRVATDVVVLEMSFERAEKLKTEFGQGLRIEPDLDLELSDRQPPG